MKKYISIKKLFISIVFIGVLIFIILNILSIHNIENRYLYSNKKQIENLYLSDKRILEWVCYKFKRTKFYT